MGATSLTHWLIVGLVLLLVFGPSRLGQVGAGLGEGIRNFKKGLNGGSDDQTRRDPARLPEGNKNET